VVLEPEIGDLVRWSRVDGNKHYLAGHAIVVEDMKNMVRIFWTNDSPIPFETLEDGDPNYENLQYDRRQMVEERERRKKGKGT
jgi:hypothetical protein